MSKLETMSDQAVEDLNEKMYTDRYCILAFIRQNSAEYACYLDRHTFSDGTDVEVMFCEFNSDRYTEFAISYFEKIKDL